MSFESIEEEWFGWNANCSDQLESISIQSQDQVYQQYLFVDKPDWFGQLDSYQQLSEVIESNSMFDESLLFPSVQSKSKDGTKENVSSKDSVNNNFCEDNIDMNKIVGELINKKATDKTNGHWRGVSKSSINNWDWNYQNDASWWSSCKGSQDLKEKEANIKQSKQAKDQSKRNSLLYTKISRISTPMVPKRTWRWGKAEDKIMYKQLCITWQQKGINVNALSLQFSLTNEQHYEALLNLKREMRWVGTTKQLLQRILKSKLFSSLYLI